MDSLLERFWTADHTINPETNCTIWDMTQSYKFLDYSTKLVIVPLNIFVHLVTISLDHFQLNGTYSCCFTEVMFMCVIKMD